MSDYHNVHWVEFFPKSRFSAPVFTAVNCMTFDALSRLTGPDADLFFATNRCFVCHHAVHRTELIGMFRKMTLVVWIGRLPTASCSRLLML
jgi:hypothetical protein